MPRKQQLTVLPHQFLDVRFPRAGIDISLAFSGQRADTTPVGVNVRTFEALTKRGRGGSRPGLSKYPAGQVPTGAYMIQDLNVIVSVGPSTVTSTHITFIQQNAKGYTDGQTDPYFVRKNHAGYSVATTGPTVTLPSVVAGDLLVLYAVNDGSGATGATVADNLGSTWYTVHANASGAGGNSFNAIMLATVAGGSGNCTITLTGGSNKWHLVACEYGGLDTTPLIDPPLDANSTGAFTNDPGTLSDSVGVTLTNELVCGYAAHKWGNHPFVATDSGWNLRYNLDGSAADAMAMRVIDRMQQNNPTSATQSVTFSGTGAGHGGVMETASFLSSSATGKRFIDYLSDVTAGNLLLFGITTKDSGSLPATVTDTVGSTWTLAGTGQKTVGGDTWYAKLYWALANASGQNTVTITSTNKKPIGMGVLEYSNVRTPSPVDDTNTDQPLDADLPTVYCGEVQIHEPYALTLALFGQGDGTYSLTLTVPGVLRASQTNGSTKFGLYMCENFSSVTLPQPISGTISAAHGVVSVVTSFKSLTTVLQSSSSGRIVTLVAVSQGQVCYTHAGESVWHAATDNSTHTSATPLQIPTEVVRSAPNAGALYYADGVHFCKFVPATNTVENWTATAGSLPRDGSSNGPRLIATWRGRTVVAGWYADPFNIAASRKGDPGDWDYSPANFDPTQAWKLSVHPAGLVPDLVTALVPYNDDILYVGGDHTIWMIQGELLDGGDIMNVSDAIGMAWGIPWVRDPYGTLYFVSNRMGIYTIVPGQQPQRISQAIEQLLLPANTGEYTIRLLWDDTYQGLHVFITANPTIGDDTHFFWEQRSGSWFQQHYGSRFFNPQCCCTFDGNSADDRVALIGSWDGYVRAVNTSITTDDGTAISSSVVMGPVVAKTLDDFLAKECQAVLGEGSGSVTFAWYVGASAEAALSSTPVATGTWSASRNLSNLIQRSGHALWVKITSTNPWAFEQLRLRVQGQGKIRQRSY